ncbi:retron system putative HNH endonuclease [Brevibacterium litoralis]|uniref:retron system putative HNH endonuclease n=1 Tax=Brevibacterium litoralis TaxID=3138935 RepID=UPI0032EB7CE9
MYRIARADPPQSFITFVQKYPAATYDVDLNSDSVLKEELREHLLRQQGGRCAYCERDISKSSSTRIEHFHPQSLLVTSADGECQKRTGVTVRKGGSVAADLAIGNLLLCCDGHEGTGEETCDKSKGNTHICEDMDNPKGLPAEIPSLVEVKHDGTVEVVRSMRTAADAQRVIDEILNLNSRTLTQNRLRVLSTWKKKFADRRKAAGKRSTVAVRSALASALRNAATSSPYPSTLESFARRLEAEVRS